MKKLSGNLLLYLLLLHTTIISAQVAEIPKTDAEKIKAEQQALKNDVSKFVSDMQKIINQSQGIVRSHEKFNSALNKFNQATTTLMQAHNEYQTALAGLNGFMFNPAQLEELKVRDEQMRQAIQKANNAKSEEELKQIKESVEHISTNPIIAVNIKLMTQLKQLQQDNNQLRQQNSWKKTVGLILGSAVASAAFLGALHSSKTITIPQKK